MVATSNFFLRHDSVKAIFVGSPSTERGTNTHLKAHPKEPCKVERMVYIYYYPGRWFMTNLSRDIHRSYTLAVSLLWW